MCVAIYKPANVTISDENLKNCFLANQHGCGFAYINTDHTGVRRIKIKKTMDYEIFKRQYDRAVRVNPESPFLIHFRIRTHGTTDKFNCHPFSVDDEHVFIHNGTITGVGTDSKKSDTQLFNEKILKKLPNGWMNEEHFKFLIEESIGYSKLAVLNIDGDVQLYNESRGSWIEGAWYSNDLWKPRATYYNRNYNSGRSYGSSYYGAKGTAATKSTTKGSTKSAATKSSDINKNSKMYKVGTLSFCTCDECASSKDSRHMFFISENTEAMAFCMVCYNKLIQKGDIDPSDRITKEHFSELVDNQYDTRVYSLSPSATIEWWGSVVDDPNDMYEDQKYLEYVGY